MENVLVGIAGGGGVWDLTGIKRQPKVAHGFHHKNLNTGTSETLHVVDAILHP